MAMKTKPCPYCGVPMYVTPHDCRTPDEQYKCLNEYCKRLFPSPVIQISEENANA